MPPVATSTITSSISNGSESVTPRMRVNGEKVEGTTPLQPEIDVKEHDFFWTYTEEPHRSRRLAIIKAHPEVHTLNFSSPSPSRSSIHGPPPHQTAHKLTSLSQVTKLCGPEPLTKYVVLLVVSIQILCAYLLRNTPFLSWKFFLTAYVIGATANQNLFLAIHEISHNLAFRSPNLNRALAIFANLPIGIPYSASFRVCLHEFYFLCIKFCFQFSQLHH